MRNEQIYQELVRTGALVANEQRKTNQLSILVDQTFDISHSDLSCLYLYEEQEGQRLLNLEAQRGDFEVPNRLSTDDELWEFLEECEETLILSARNTAFFHTAFLNSAMNSSVVLPLFTATTQLGYLILNATEEAFFGSEEFYFLDSFVRLSSGMVQSAQLYRDLERQFKEVELLERYQENIFASMTDLLITTDAKGHIHYFNQAALERLGLKEDLVGEPFEKVFNASLGKKVLKAINEADVQGEAKPGIEGIMKRKEDEDMDFRLNISPLRGKRGKKEGLTLLFTDQTHERQLQSKMESVVEERRIVKDMFARYLSSDIVQTLVDRPDLVKPGGDKKMATILFADIRGYTSFSETKDPQYIIGVLNAYFSEAVEIIIKYKGYIDKFIGDAIMAAWGVPIYSEEDDARAAVECAVELQNLINSKDRNFFTGDASHLRVGIGMHTGPLIAGNLGSNRRMDYSVIGDTVNVAARLEGVAGPGQVIITQKTRDLIGDKFKVKALEPVQVKGKVKPLNIYNVLKKIE
ncbi:MAG: PAS domain S-box protein [Spirochaetaceae bacterium]|nr:PAS domain S-box protein [Spirochaetaceae bacterium]